MAELKQMAQKRAARMEQAKAKHFLIKFTRFEHSRVQAQADKYTGGNLSEWLRYAGNLEPRAEDLANLERSVES